MPIIIDTCVLLWMVGDPKKLSENAVRLIQENKADLYVSAISAFEISIKHKKKKLCYPQTRISGLSRPPIFTI